MKLIHIIGLLIGLMIGVTFQACGPDSNSQEEEKIAVNGKKIVLSEMPDPIEFSGNIEGIQRVKLSTKLMGTITYLPFTVGSKVNRGQILARINSSDLLAKKQQVRASITQAEAALTNMKINYERVKSLYEKKSATAKEMEDIQMAFDMAQAQAKAAREMEKEIDDVLGYAVITAPFDGFIVNKFYQEGDLAAPGHPLLIVENFSTFKVNASVSASEINRFKVGDAVQIRLEELNGKLLPGEVSAISMGAHPASRQYQVEIIIKSDNENISGIKSGMYAKIVLLNQLRKLIRIDREHLIERGQLRGVFTVSMNDEVLLRWLRLGKEFDGQVEVLSGLNEGDIVILDKTVREGQKVEVRL
jgi:RND family efflux transporter MFP subunit